jgi:DNA-binding transcriptional LysR family regulator
MDGCRMRKPHRIVSDPWRDQLARVAVFEEVARARSFTLAARNLGLSQPSVSRAVAALEAHLGTPLIERQGRALRLTRAGEATFASARRVREELDALGAKIGHDRAPRGDYVCFGAEHVAAHLLASPIAALADSHPLLLPRVVTGPAHLAVEEIADGRAEVGFYFKAEPNARTEARPLASFACRLVCHPDAMRNERVLTSFIGSREIDDRRNTAFPTLDMLRQHRPKTKITYSSNNLALHIRWVEEKVGISILPTFLVEDAIAKRKLRVIHPEWTYWAELVAVVRRGSMLSVPTRTLLKTMRAACAALGGKPAAMISGTSFRTPT